MTAPLQNCLQGLTAGLDRVPPAVIERQALVLHVAEQYRRLFPDPSGRGVPH